MFKFVLLCLVLVIAGAFGATTQGVENVKPADIFNEVSALEAFKIMYGEEGTKALENEEEGPALRDEIGKMPASKMLNFEDETVAVAILFYDGDSTKCPKCDAARKAYAEAVEKTQEDQPEEIKDLFKWYEMDCYVDEESELLCQEYQFLIEGHSDYNTELPRLVFSTNGGQKQLDYPGRFTVNDLYSSFLYINNVPVSELIKIEDYDSFMEVQEDRFEFHERVVKFVACLGSEDDAAAFYTAVQALFDGLYTHVDYAVVRSEPLKDLEDGKFYDEEVALRKHHNLPANTITVTIQTQVNGETKVESKIFTDDVTDIRKVDIFLTQYAYPSYQILTAATMKRLFASRIPAFIVVTSVNDAHDDRVEKIFQAIGDEYYPDMHLYLIHEEILAAHQTDVYEKFGVEGGVPAALILSAFTSHVHFHPTWRSGDISLHTKSNYQAFIEQFLAGEIKYERKVSQEPSTNPDSDNVHYIVGDKMEQYIEQCRENEGDLVVVFYKEGCKACEETFKAFSEFVERYNKPQTKDKVIFAKMDLLKDDPPSYIEIGNVPVIMVWNSVFLEEAGAEFGGIPIFDGRMLAELDGALQQKYFPKEEL